MAKSNPFDTARQLLNNAISKVGNSVGIQGYNQNGLQVRNNSFVGNILNRGEQLGQNKTLLQAPTAAFSARGNIVPSMQTIGSALGNRQVGEDAGYALRGALSLTPFQANSIVPQVNKQGVQQFQNLSNPQTMRQQTAQSLGRAAYGTALTAPVAGGALGMARNAVVGAGLGVGMGVGSDLLSGTPITKQGVAEHALSGLENAWVLPITNALTDKVLMGFAPKLVGSALTEPFKIGQVKKGFGQLLLRAIAESPAENTAFTFLNRLDKESKQSFMEDWIKALPGTVGSNLVFAGINGTFNAAKEKESRTAINKSLQETLRKWSTPVTTMELDPKTGKRVKMSMFEYKLKNSVGLQAQDINTMPIEDYAKAKGITIPEAEKIFAQRNTQPKGVGGINPIEQDAVKQFGYTTKPKEALFITSDGKFIDGTGKSQVGPSQRQYMTERTVDHREVASSVNLGSGSGSDLLSKYMDTTGNVRMSLNGGDLNVDVIKRPNLQQLEAIKQSSVYGDKIIADISNARGDRVESSVFKNFDQYKKWLDKYLPDTNKDLEDFLNGKIKDTVNPKVISSQPVVPEGGVKTTKLQNSVPLEQLRQTNPEYVNKIANPDGTITVYRNVGNDATRTLMPNDYVSFDKNYAKGLKAGGKVIEQKVPISDVRIATGMDSTVRSEGFYSPQPEGGVENMVRQKADKVLKLMGNSLGDVSVVGSTAKGKVNPNDLDILITPTNKLKQLDSTGLNDRIDLQNVFKDELQSLFPNKKIHVTIADYDPARGPKMAISGLPQPEGGVGVTAKVPEVSTAKTVEQPQVVSAPSQGETALNPKPLENPSDPYYNIKRMGVDDTTKQAVSDAIVTPQIKQQIEGIVGKPLTFEEVKLHAQVAEELNKNFTRAETDQLGASALALRNKVADLAKLNISSDEFNEALIKDKSFGAYLARLLGQRRIVSDPSKVTIYNKMIGEILKTGVDPEEVIKASKGIDLNNPKQATEFYRKYVKATPGEWVDKLRYNSMLSSPNTHIINISSNLQGTGVLTPIQKTIEGGIDSVVSALTGKKRTRFAGEGPKYAEGYYKAVGEAYRNMKNAFTGADMVENPDMRNIPLSTGGKSQAVEKLLDIPSKALNAMDIFFRTLTESGLKSSYEYKLSKGGADLSPKVRADAERLLFRGDLVESGAGAISNAVGAGAEWVSKATHARSLPVRWLAKLTLPFVRTGTNLAKAGLEGNPLTGSLNMIGNKDKTAQAAKMIMGGTVMAIGGSMALADRLTFGEPTDPKNKSAFRAAGMQPYSFKVGDKWINYSKLHPLIAFQLGTVAALNQARKDSKLSDNQTQVIADGLMNSLKFFADQTYFKNIGDFVNGAYGDIERFSQIPTNYATQLIPFRALMSWVTRIIDGYQRKPDQDAGFFVKSFQQVASQLPILSTMVPERTGPNGEPIFSPLGERIFNSITPNKVTTENEYNKKMFDYATNALRTYKGLKELQPDEANRIVAELKAKKPELYGQIKKLFNDDKANITSRESSIRTKGVDSGERANAIKNDLKKLDTPEKKNALIKRYRSLGIITDSVSKQLKQMRERGEL